MIPGCRWGAEHLLLLWESWWGLQLNFVLRLGPGWERRWGNLPPPPSGETQYQPVSGNPDYIFLPSLFLYPWRIYRCEKGVADSWESFCLQPVSPFTPVVPAISVWCSALLSAQQNRDPHWEWAPHVSVMLGQSQPPFVISLSPSCSFCPSSLPQSPRPFASSAVGLLSSFSWSAPPSFSSTPFALSMLCSIFGLHQNESTGDDPSSWFRSPQLCVVPSPNFGLLTVCQAELNTSN